MDALSTNTNFDTGSHAHPITSPPSSRAFQERRVRALVARQPIAVSLRGLPREHARTVSDILAPKIRRSQFKQEVMVNHLDLTECWRGLSPAQATELTMWYHLLHECLQDEVRTALYEDVVRDLLKNHAIDEVYLVPRILDCLQSNTQRIIDVDFIDIIDGMMGKCHDYFPNKSAVTTSNWSHFSGGLSLFLHNFLRLQDCFRYSSNGTCLEIDFDFQYTDGLLTATGYMTWQPPEVRFFALADHLQAGKEYRITPFILKNVLNPFGPLGCDEYVDQATYTLVQSSLNFRWDSLKQCFKSWVPDYADGTRRALKTVLKATVVTPFPGNVSLERQSRWNIRLDITPASHNHLPLAPSLGLYAGHTGLHQNQYMHLLSRDISTESMRSNLRHSDFKSVQRRTLDDSFDSLSSQKRKVSQPIRDDVLSDIKRRRHGPVDEVENEQHAQPVSHEDRYALSPQANSSREELLADCRFLNSERRTQVLALVVDFLHRTRANRSDVYRDHVYSANDQVGSSHLQLGQRDSSMASLNTDPSSLNISAPDSAVDVGHIDFPQRQIGLQQEQIQRNYREFSGRKLRRSTGLISPVSDGERMAFEDIFLEDSPGWSPITENNADAMDTMMGHV